MLIQCPGDTVHLKNGTFHAVLTIYPNDTPVDKQLALIIGEHMATKNDIKMSYDLFSLGIGYAVNNQDMIDRAFNLMNEFCVLWYLDKGKNFY